jgi:hypothetical protein
MQSGKKMYESEAVKKFRGWEIGNPYHVQGRGKFTPPKKALGSPLPTDN